MSQFRPNKTLGKRFFSNPFRLFTNLDVLSGFNEHSKEVLGLFAAWDAALIWNQFKRSNNLAMMNSCSSKIR